MIGDRPLHGTGPTASAFPAANQDPIRFRISVTMVKDGASRILRTSSPRSLMYARLAVARRPSRSRTDGKLKGRIAPQICAITSRAACRAHKSQLIEMTVRKHRLRWMRVFWRSQWPPAGSNASSACWAADMLVTSPAPVPARTRGPKNQLVENAHLCPIRRIRSTSSGGASWSWRELKDKNVVKQNRDYSCGAASLCTLLKYYWGDNVTEQKDPR